MSLSFSETKNNPQQIQALLNQGTRLRERKKGQRPHNHMDKSEQYVQREGGKEEVEMKEENEREKEGERDVSTGLHISGRLRKRG